ncbi:ABC transporter permease [Allokutzneria sp. A3M-2-11 16]|uniref:ABC transporter permease n=1 Tax=Allokutzneria sp. A3M-2-11 16 TaxID=2962043 RepID=UPI0020B8E53A|nr:ABC transporter permease [Allokutzneria sp. A3M-2-11 16]MCP3799306.1 ABC transporter permease [Allokutzneria sp. A3M-2-11 16]
MNPTWNAVRLGLRRGGIELRQSLTTPQDLLGYFFPVVVFTVVLFFVRDAKIAGTFSVGELMLPSIVGMSIAVTGLVNLAQLLTVEREDGTLLRAKSTPNGMVGYLVGKTVLISGTTVISVTVQLGAATVLLDGVGISGAGSGLTLVWVVALGLLATLPVGAILGSLVSNSRSVGVVMLPVMAVAGSSGIFYPLSQMPEWMQGLAQVFPVYWLGLGTRSALLPEGMAGVEVGQSWRHLETFGVLGAWAVVGLLLAPIVLRRMARRESGSSVEARKRKAMQSIG